MYNRFLRYFHRIGHRYNGNYSRNQPRSELNFWSIWMGNFSRYKSRHRQWVVRYGFTSAAEKFSNFVFLFCRQIQNRLREVLLCSIGVYVTDWESQCINCQELKPCANELKVIDNLLKSTFNCKTCGKMRRTRYEKNANVDCSLYCKCKKIESKKEEGETYGWDLFLEKEGLIIWRKLQKPSLYAYKVYAKYTDITAKDFINAQMDIAYRKEWDDTTAKLEILEYDPTDYSHIIYWEVKWPRLFTNRDYVFFRKQLVDKAGKVAVICNRSTTHPRCPEYPNKQRVTDYWSYMVVKPIGAFEEPGFEFVLTYFDNPGLAVPSTFTTWVAETQMPHFLKKLYTAAKDYSIRS